MKHITENQQQVINTLLSTGINFVIAGGFARDAGHNLIGRDLDIVLFNTDYTVYDELTNIMQRHNVLVEILDVYNKSDARISSVLKLAHDIDIILWNPDKYSTLQEVLNDFDFNINQYVMDPVSERVTYLGRHEGILTPLRPLESLTDKRITRIKEVAEQYEWNTECLDKKIQ